MLKNSKFSIWLALMLAVILMTGMPSWALAQCGGGSGNMGSMHDQHMGSSAQMGSGQMGMYGTQAPVQPTPNAVAPGYVAPTPPNTGGYGQMMNQGGMGSGHQGHTGQ